MNMSVVVDADVRAVAEFMQGKVAASRLVAVADGLAAIAPLLWGRYQTENIEVLRLDAPISAAGQTPTASSE